MYLSRYIEPEAAGYLIAEHIRCGKAGCLCAKDQKHGPYWYLHYRCFENGRWRARKRYVPLSRVQVVRNWLKQNKDRDRACMKLLGQSSNLRGATKRHKMGKITPSEWKDICDGITRKAE